MINVDLRDEDQAEMVLQTLDTLRDHAAAAGLWADVVPAQTMTAAWVNEFGCTIPMTPRMRAYLAALARAYNIVLQSRGGSRGVVVIPARPYIRRAVDEHREDLAQLAEDQMRVALRFGDSRSAMRALVTIAAKLEALIKMTINRVQEPPLHPLTVAMKRSAKPLVNTGTLRRSIRFAVVRVADGGAVERGSTGG